MKVLRSGEEASDEKERTGRVTRHPIWSVGMICVISAAAAGLSMCSAERKHGRTASAHAKVYPPATKARKREREVGLWKLWPFFDPRVFTKGVVVPQRGQRREQEKETGFF